MKKSTRMIILSSFTAITVAVITITLLAIVKHKEPVFIEGSPTWQKSDFPLVVSVAGGTSEARRIVRQATQDVNRRMAFFVFTEYTDNTPTSQVSIQIAPEDEVVERGGISALLHEGPHATQCVVRIANLTDPVAIYRTALHELGHCLGLAHDPFKSSIMYHMFVEYEPGVRNISFTDTDKAAVRHRYQ